MSALEDMVRNAIADESFRKTLMEDPAAALAGFHLSEEEKAIILNAKGKDFSTLMGELSLNKRVSKTLGFGALSFLTTDPGNNAQTDNNP
jgi:hypothetical protein